MVWREEKDHITDYYFCMINLKGINHKNKQHVQYSTFLFAIRPIPHDPDLPVPEPNSNIEYSPSSEHRGMTIVAGDDAYNPEEDDQPVTLTQAELNDLTRNLNLSKESAHLLGLHLKAKHLLASETTFYWYRDREREWRQFFTFQDVIINLLQHCWIKQISGLTV